MEKQKKQLQSQFLVKLPAENINVKKLVKVSVWEWLLCYYLTLSNNAG